MSTSITKDGMQTILHTVKRNFQYKQSNNVIGILIFVFKGHSFNLKRTTDMTHGDKIISFAIGNDATDSAGRVS